MNNTTIDFTFDKFKIKELMKNMDIAKPAYIIMNETTALFMKYCGVDGSNYPYDCKYYQGCKVLFDNTLNVGEIRLAQ